MGQHLRAKLGPAGRVERSDEPVQDLSAMGLLRLGLGTGVAARFEDSGLVRLAGRNGNNSSSCSRASSTRPAGPSFALRC